MIRYFISYKNLILEKDYQENINIFNPKLKIFKKNKDGSYRGEPILAFNGYVKDIVSYINILENNKKGIYLMYELDKKEIEKFNKIYIKKFETEDNKKFIHQKDNEIKLINFNTYVNMPYKDISSKNSDIVKVYKLGKSKNDYKVSILYKSMTLKERNELIKNSIGSDIYFYTDNEDILEKYENDLTVLIETDFDNFKLTKHKIFTIDSIPQNIVYDFTLSTRRMFYNLCDHSLPTNIIETKYDTYNFEYKLDNTLKKVYIMKSFDIKNIIYDLSIVPLLKYINVFELNNDGYKKINIEEYLQKENILKYIKKPSKN